MKKLSIINLQNYLNAKYIHFGFFRPYIFILSICLSSFLSSCTRDYSSEDRNNENINKDDEEIAGIHPEQSVSTQNSKSLDKSQQYSQGTKSYIQLITIAPQSAKKITAKEYAEKGEKIIPEFSRWEANMMTYGLKHCKSLKDKSRGFDQNLADTYYDAEWIFYRIGDYIGDPTWKSCADAAEKIYREQFVFANNGNVPGYWNFTHGLVEDVERTGDATSKKAVADIVKHGAFARDSTGVSETADVAQSREAAYVIMAYLNAEKLGIPRQKRLNLLLTHAFDHMDQWFISKKAPYIKTFMVGLTSQSLITYYERSRDPKVLEIVKTAADYLWANLWVKDSQAFRYMDRKTGAPDETTDPAPDLNMIVAPVYAWIYSQTGDKKYAEIADTVFAGGVRGAWLDNAKQFNQSYRWSFDYVRWRLDQVEAK
jgi:hypothetical protein